MVVVVVLIRWWSRLLFVWYSPTFDFALAFRVEKYPSIRGRLRKRQWIPAWEKPIVHSPVFHRSIYQSSFNAQIGKCVNLNLFLVWLNNRKKRNQKSNGREKAPWNKDRYIIFTLMVYSIYILYGILYISYYIVYNIYHIIFNQEWGPTIAPAEAVDWTPARSNKATKRSTLGSNPTESCQMNRKKWSTSSSHPLPPSR